MNGSSQKTTKRGKIHEYFHAAHYGRIGSSSYAKKTGNGDEGMRMDMEDKMEVATRSKLHMIGTTQLRMNTEENSKKQIRSKKVSRGIAPMEAKPTATGVAGPKPKLPH